MTSAVTAKKKRGRKPNDDSGLLTVAVSGIQPRWLGEAVGWSVERGFGKSRASAIRALLREWYEGRVNGDVK